MSSQSTQPNLPPALAEAMDAVGRNPQNIDALVRLGGLLHDHGEHEQANKVRQHLVSILNGVVTHGAPPLDTIYNLLLILYQQFVKKIETEEQARTCFQSWLGPIVEYGRRFRDPALPRSLWQPTAERPWRAAFFLQSSTILGHTAALFELLEHLPRGLPWHNQPVVYVFKGADPELTARITALGTHCVNVQLEMSPHGFQTQLEWLRRRIAEDNVSHFVWVSAPAAAELAMSTRLAPVQVFWTLKFHPFQIPEIDGYITYGAWSEETRVLHGETWQVVPFMVAQPSRAVTADEVAAIRAQYAQHDLLFGTLARPEKLNSVPYLKAVVQILRDNPQAGFLWTGHRPLPHVQDAFEQGGVAARCHFIGWVDTPLYARVLDVFLESFPFGCGLTGIQALEAGTPFLSYAAPETQFGMHFLRPLQDGGAAADAIRSLLAPADGSGPLLYAGDADEYVALANRLAREPGFRRAVGLAGQNYFRRYLTDADRMGQRFMQVLADTKKPQEALA